MANFDLKMTEERISSITYNRKWLTFEQEVLRLSKNINAKELRERVGLITQMRIVNPLDMTIVLCIQKILCSCLFFAVN